MLFFFKEPDTAMEFMKCEVTATAEWRVRLAQGSLRAGNDYRAVLLWMKKDTLARNIRNLRPLYPNWAPFSISQGRDLRVAFEKFHADLVRSSLSRWRIGGCNQRQFDAEK